MNSTKAITEIRYQAEDILRQMTRLQNGLDEPADLEAFSVLVHQWKKLNNALSDAEEIYRSFENRASEIFNEEIEVFPDTIFAESHFPELKKFEEVRMIRTE